MSKRRRKTSHSLWSSSSKKRRNSGSRKKSGEDNSGVGCLLILLAVGLVAKVFENIEKFFKYIANKIREMDFSVIKTILVFALVGVVLFEIVILIKKTKWAEEKRKQRAERKECKACLRSIERKQERPCISSSMEFSNKEEEEVNVAFRSFVLRVWELNRAQSHIEYLNARYQAFLKLDKKKKAEETRAELVRWENALEEAMKSLPKAFSSIWCSKFYDLNEVKRRYALLIESVPSETIVWVSAFFKGDAIKTVKIDNSASLIFTPLYVLHYTGLEHTIRLIKYENVKISSNVTTERLQGAVSQGMEIAYIGYQYMNKDGSRDRRYSYNPQYTYVYHGKLVIIADYVHAVIERFNRVNTQTCAEKAQAFLELMRGKYGLVAEKLINHEIPLGSSDSTPASALNANRSKAYEMELKKKAEAERELREAEELQKWKEMAERRYREAQAEVVRKREETERQLRADQDLQKEETERKQSETDAKKNNAEEHLQIKKIEVRDKPEESEEKSAQLVAIQSEKSDETEDSLAICTKNKQNEIQKAGDAMRQPLWDKYETALLIEAYWKIRANNSIKNHIVSELSAQLRKRASIDIDETYRNENGIRMRLGEIDCLFNGGQSGLKNTSELFREMTDMYVSDRRHFDEILMEARSTNDSQNDQRLSFIQWLGENVPKLNPEEVCNCLAIGEEFCLRLKVLEKPLFETTDIGTVAKFAKTVSKNRVFRLRNQKKHLEIESAANWYEYYVRTEFVKQSDKTESVVSVGFVEEEHVIQANDILLDCFANLVNKYPEFVFTNLNSKGAENKRAVYIFPKDSLRHGNVAIEIWHRTDGMFDIYIQRALLSEEENKESVSEGRAVLTRRWKIRDELVEFVSQKLEIARNNPKTSELIENNKELEKVSQISTKEKSKPISVRDGYLSWVNENLPSYRATWVPKNLMRVERIGYSTKVLRQPLYETTDIPILEKLYEKLKRAVSFGFVDKSLYPDIIDDFYLYIQYCRQHSIEKNVLPELEIVDGKNETESIVSVETEGKKGLRSVLEKYYQYGIRYDSVRELMRLRNYAEELGVHLPENDDDLKKQILTCGPIIDGRVHVKSDDVGQEIKKMVQEIFASGVQAVYFEALIERKSEWMSEHFVTSGEMLKELLQKTIPEYYYARKFMLDGQRKTEKEIVTSEIKRVWGDNQLCAVDELSRRLPYIPVGNIWRVISGNPYFVYQSEGVYLDVDRLIMSEQEEEDILEYVEKTCSEKGFASLADIPLGDIIEQNYELSSLAIFNAIYNRLLMDKYRMKDKILTKDGKELSAVLLLRQYLEGKEECTFTEVADRVIELTGSSNRQFAFEALYGSMIRTEVNRFVADNYVDFNIEQIDSAISEIADGAFCAIKDITTFAMFPVCGVPWNHYLLESYCYRFSKKYALNVLNFNDRNAGIIVNRNYNKTYAEMLAIVVAKSNVVLEPEQVGRYLNQAGYLAKSKYGNLDQIARRAQAIREEK